MSEPRKKFPQFVAEEVWAVARALLADSTRLDDAGRNAYMICNCCGAASYYSWKTHDVESPIVHKPGCAVPVALDLLTGAPDV